MSVPARFSWICKTLPLLIVFAGTSLLPSSAAETVTVTDIHGLTTTGELQSFSNDALGILSTKLVSISLSETRSIAFERATKERPRNGFAVWLSNGDRISARAVKVSDDSLTVSWRALGTSIPPTIALEKVVALIFELPTTNSERFRLFADIETLPPGNDVVMLSNGDRSQGEFERLDATFIELKVGNSTLKLDRSRVRAIRLNPELTNARRSTGQRTMLLLNDGSRITATHLELSNGDLKLKSPVLGNINLPLSCVSSCDLFSEQIIPITEYEPANVEFTPYLSANWGLHPNANVLHGPLRIRGAEFATGLGMHSRMSVSYNLLGHERAFQSLVGIDDAANGAGSAVFSVELDGKKVWSSLDVTGKSPAVRVPSIDVHGHQRLTLVVDFGQFADVSDYADWCDAVLIVDPRK